MHRGTTQTIHVAMKGIDTKTITALIITIEQGKRELDKKGKDLLLMEGAADVYLTQADTLYFKEGTASVQGRGITKDGGAFATTIKQIKFEKVLKEGVISDGG